MSLIRRPNLAILTALSDSDADAIIAAYTGATAPARDIRLVTSAVKALKRDSLWSLIEAMWVPAAQDAASGDVNWKTPGTNNLTRVNSPSFTAYAGFVSDGSTSYANTGVNIGDGGAHTALQDSTTLWVATGSDQQSSTAFVIGTTDNRIAVRRDSNNVSARVNQSGSTISGDGVSTTSAGVLTAASRTAANVIAIYRDSNSLIADTTASQAPDNLPIYLGAIRGTTNPSSFAQQRVAAAGIASGLTSAQWYALRAILWTYLNAVNPVVWT